MLSPPWAEIRTRVESERSAVALNRDAARVRRTAEVFTPTDLVLAILERLPLSALGPGRLVLDPACGDGQFLSGVKWLKVLHFGMTEAEAVHDLFGVDIMLDNVTRCRRRLRGGTIVVGDVLKPFRDLPGQTDEDRQVLRTILSNEDVEQGELFSVSASGSR